MTGLTATIDPRAAGEDRVVTLRVSNASDTAVQVVNPNMGRPAPNMNWPHSIEVYRASLLMEYGHLAVSVTDEGADVPLAMISTWATPVMPAPVSLEPGDSLEVPIPLGRFFPLEAGRRYQVTAEYGDAALRVKADGPVEIPAG